MSAKIEVELPSMRGAGATAVGVPIYANPNGKAELPHPVGLSALVEELVDLPSQALQRELQPGENVVASYDVYFPSRYIPRWKVILLCFMTLGGYFIYMLYQRLLAWFYKRRYCTPALVQMTRGTMAVTDKGRAICWSSHTVQTLSKAGGADPVQVLVRLCFPKTFQQPVTYTTETEVRTWNLNDLRQMSTYFDSDFGCRYFLCVGPGCCLTYKARLALQFNEFDYYKTNTSKYISVAPRLHFLDRMKKLAEDSAAMCEQWVGLAHQENTIMITGKTEDAVHDCNPHDVMDDLTRLQSGIMQHIPAQPDVFLPAGGANSMNEASARATSWLMSDREDVQLVDDSGKVQLPKRYLPLLPGEHVTGAMGMVYRMKCFEWFLTLITVGIYYIVAVRPKKMERSACVITNKRFVEVLIRQRAGTIPSHLGEVTLQVRSFFPQTVTAGYIKGSSYLSCSGMCLTRKNNIEASIQTPAGDITINAPATQIAFIRALHYTVSRGESLDMSVAPVNAEDTKLDDVYERDAVPLFGDEKLLRRLNGGGEWEPVCTDNKLCVQMANDACVMPGEPRGQGVCSKETLGSCFPCLPWCCTCGLRPYYEKKNLIVTDKTLFFVKGRRNYPLLKCLATYDSYTVAWVPIRSFRATELSIKAFGDENWYKRLAYNCGKSNNCCRWLSANCCPVITSAYTMKVKVGQFAFTLSEKGLNVNWNTDETVLAMRRTLGAIQVAVAEDMNMKACKV